jgi:hypothetical protein
VERASGIALKEIFRELETNMDLRRVIIVCFDRLTYETYLRMEKELSGTK